MPSEPTSGERLAVLVAGLARLCRARHRLDRGPRARRRGLGRHHRGRRARGGLPQPAGHFGPVRLPAQAAAARLLGRRRADRRIRRGAAQPDADRGHPQGHEGRGAGHRGLAFLFARRRRLPRPDARRAGQSGPGQEPGRVDHHHAGRAQRLPVLGKDLHPQALRGAAHVQARAPAEQGPDPRDLHEPDLPGQPRLRLRGRLGHLFRQADEGPHHRRGGDAGGPAEVALGQQPDQQPDAGPVAPALHHRPDGGKRLHHGRGSRKPPRSRN